MGRVQSAPPSLGEALVARAYLESTVARLALRALHGVDLDGLFGDAVSVITSTIDTGRVHLLELQGDATPRLRIGVGPMRGIADRAAAALVADRAPVDLNATLPPESPEAQPTTSFVIRGRHGPVGVLDVEARRGRLKPEEAHFVQSVADVLGGAMQRERDVAAMRASEERFRLLVEGVRDHALILLDPEGRIATWNTGAQRLRGFTSEQIIGRHFSCLYCKVDVEAGRPAADLAVASSQGRVDYEGWQARVDGSRFFANVAIAPARDERKRLVGYSHLTHDISARMKADQDRKLLAETGAALSETLDPQATLERVAQLAVPVFADWCVVDLDANDGADRIAVAHADPALVARAKALSAAISVDRDAPKPAGWETGTPTGVIRIGAPVLVTAVDDPARHAQSLHLLPDTNVRSYICVPLRARGRTLGVITFVAAESRRHYDESDLGFAEELARRCALALDNATLYKQAQDAVRARDQFFSIASHELKTPLAALQLYLQSLLRAVEEGPRDPELLERVAAKAGTAVRQVARLARLADTVLDATQLERGLLEIQPLEYDAAEMVREIADRFGDAAAEVASALNLSVPPSLIVRWDRIRMEQVVTNLVSNALKYSPGRPVEVELGRRDGQAVLRVTDHGNGIAAKDLNRIFRPFGRVPSESSPPGLGLGLYIAKRIVEAHGGAIEATSAEGGGATFTAVLPMQAEMSAVAPADRAAVPKLPLGGQSGSP